MEKLIAILKDHVADGENTKDRLLGASFVVVSKDGKSSDFPTTNRALPPPTLSGKTRAAGTSTPLLTPVRAKDILFSGSAGRTAKDPAAPAWTEDTFTWLASMGKIVTINACL